MTFSRPISLQTCGQSEAYVRLKMWNHFLHWQHLHLAAPGLYRPFIFSDWALPAIILYHDFDCGNWARFRTSEFWFGMWSMAFSRIEIFTRIGFLLPLVTHNMWYLLWEIRCSAFHAQRLEPQCPFIAFSKLHNSDICILKVRTPFVWLATLDGPLVQASDKWSRQRRSGTWGSRNACVLIVSPIKG